MNRDTKLTAILKRQYRIILTALEEIYSVLGVVAYFLPTSRQYNAVLPSQNSNKFILKKTWNITFLV